MLDQRLQVLSPQAALYHSPAANDYGAHPGTLSSFTGSQSAPTKRRILGELSQSIGDRRYPFPGGACVWAASSSLSRHAENPFAALRQCGSYEPGTNAQLIRWNASRQNAPLEIRRFSSRGLSLRFANSIELRKSHFSGTIPPFINIHSSKTAIPDRVKKRKPLAPRKRSTTRLSPSSYYRICSLNIAHR